TVTMILKRLRTSVQPSVSPPSLRRSATLVQLLRPYQWSKNLLLLVPLLTSHTFNDAALLTRAITAMVVFSLAASGMYVLNDLLDIELDRKNATKNRRTLDSGAVSIR